MASSEGAISRGPRGGSSGARSGRGGGQRSERERGDRDRDYRTSQTPVFDHQRRGGGGSRIPDSERRDRDQGPHNNGGHKGVSGPNLRGIRNQLPPRLAKISGTDSDEIYNDKNCIVCYKEVKYYSVGSCNHSVCYECSGRMRVLMEQNECPICRQTLEFVVMTQGLKSFGELQNRLRMFIWLPQWGIYMEGEEVHQDFETLLEHRCQFCKEPEPKLFPTFKELKSHVHRVHEMYACDLCAENIKLFSKERRFYTRQELATHKRKGDRADKSHRGHPICEFCDRRYFDSDELYKHLRKDHYFCHFCDADGLNHYYNTYDDLRIHFRKEHFLCEEEGCKEEKFTSVFRSDIDMKAHLTAIHSRLLGKHGTKAARLIDVEFGLASDEDRRLRRFNGDGFVGRGGRRGDRGGDYNHDGEDYEDERNLAAPHFEPTIHAQPKVDSVADFPHLEGAKGPAPLPVMNGGSHANSSIAQKVALASGKNVINKQKDSAGGGRQGPRWNAKVTGSSRHDEEFPALGPDEEGLPAPRPFPNSSAMPVASHLKKPAAAPTDSSRRNGFARPVQLSSAMEEFPSLGKTASSSTTNGSAWVGSGVKMKKQVPRSLKVARAPLERKIEVDPYDNFQFVPLSVSRARRDSLTEKYECILAEEQNRLDGTEDKGTKKKKKGKNDNSSNNNNSASKTVAAIFTDVKPTPRGKSPSKNDPGPKTTFQDDFPSLAPARKVRSPPKQQQPSSPPGPAGSLDISGITISSPGRGPPPGFSKPVPAQELLDMSFLTKTKTTNHNNNVSPAISEDLELLRAKQGSIGKIYVQPPEFGRRSGRLLEAVKSSLNGDESSFELFKSVSNQYRKGDLSSKEYYELCQDIFGISDFRIIFPELLALLPEIGKQQELLASHRRAGGLMKDLTSCQECFQVLKTGDLSSHRQSHAVGEVFPAL